MTGSLLADFCPGANVLRRFFGLCGAGLILLLSFPDAAACVPYSRREEREARLRSLRDASCGAGCGG